MESDWLALPPMEMLGHDAPPDLARQAQAKEFSQLYRIFVDDERGRQLLAHWDKAVRRKRVPAGATTQEYAYLEGMRNFVQEIQDQIELSTQ